jgi:uncharacterized protein (UPF0332 family)
MTLTPEDRATIAQLRLRNARETLDDARMLLDAQSIRSAVNRAYYAMFYAASALAVARGRAFSKHSGLLAYIHGSFVNAGLLDRKYGRAFQKAFENRSESDYQDRLRLSAQDVASMISDAQAFIEALSTLVAGGPEGSGPANPTPDDACPV